MTSCDNCETIILFGGVRNGKFRFCSESCQSKGHLILLAHKLPQEMVDQYVNETHKGQCPKCHGKGPIDAHISYKIWSALLFSSYKSDPQISCCSCGIKSQISSVFYCFFLGWWEFPWGLIITPIQIIRNFIALFKKPNPMKPSPQLEKLVRMNLVAVVESQSVKQTKN